MLIKIDEFEFTECWDGVLNKKLSDYPKITDWEIQTVLDFIRYESEYGRTCEIEAEDSILHAMNNVFCQLSQDVQLKFTVRNRWGP